MRRPFFGGPRASDRLRFGLRSLNGFGPAARGPHDPGDTMSRPYPLTAATRWAIPALVSLSLAGQASAATVLLEPQEG